jgi:hypothetical protein
MGTPLRNPEKIGSLSPAETVAFSQPFQHNWEATDTVHRRIGEDGLMMQNANTVFTLPPTYEQFLPALQLAMDHELSVRGFRQVMRSVLTARQSEIRAGLSQQDGFLKMRAHQDLRSTIPSLFYTISDICPTDYLPTLNDKIGDTSKEDIIWIRLEIFHLQRLTKF